MATQISPELLIDAYARGFFPMAVAGGRIQWFSPDPRGVIPLDGFHIPHGTRKTLADPAWEVRVNTAFEEVMRSCADRAETWIDERIIRIYVDLSRRGIAHSVEIWREGQLAGGLYGVQLGAVFFGESMFHRVGGASKVALIALHRILVAGGFKLLDIQWTTPHLEKFGAVEISRQTYLRQLTAALQCPANFSAGITAVPDS
jgi:leucyl/phenylalanyl-tRNA--protein transferase